MEQESETSDAHHQPNEDEQETPDLRIPAARESVTPHSNVNTTLHNIDNSLANLQEQYHALHNQGTDPSNASPSNKKVIKLTHIQTKQLANPTVIIESSNYHSPVAASSKYRGKGSTPASPGTIHKALIASGGSENLHSGSSNQELDSVDDQNY